MSHMSTQCVLKDPPPTTPWPILYVFVFNDDIDPLLTRVPFIIPLWKYETHYLFRPLRIYGRWFTHWRRERDYCILKTLLSMTDLLWRGRRSYFGIGISSITLSFLYSDTWMDGPVSLSQYRYSLRVSRHIIDGQRDPRRHLIPPSPNYQIKWTQLDPKV